MDTLSLILNLVSLIVPTSAVSYGYGKFTQKIKDVQDEQKTQKDENEKKFEKIEARDQEKDKQIEVIKKERQDLVVGIAEMRIEIRQLIDATKNSQEVMRTMQEAIQVLQSKLMRKK